MHTVVLIDLQYQVDVSGIFLRLFLEDK